MERPRIPAGAAAAALLAEAQPQRAGSPALSSHSNSSTSGLYLQPGSGLLDSKGSLAAPLEQLASLGGVELGGTLMAPPVAEDSGALFGASSSGATAAAFNHQVRARSARYGQVLRAGTAVGPTASAGLKSKRMYV